MSTVEPLVRLGRVFQTEDLGDGNLEMSALDRAAESLELATTNLGVVRLDAKTATLSRYRLDSVRIGNPTAMSQGVQATRQFVAANEGEHGVDSVGREALRRCPDVVTAAVDYLVGA
jgi:hypothetical protein